MRKIAPDHPFFRNGEANERPVPLRPYRLYRTLETMVCIFRELGYRPLEPYVLKALMHRVPQKRERLVLVAFRNDTAGEADFRWLSAVGKIFTVRDALWKGELFPTDVPESAGDSYSEQKRRVMELVSPGGYWRDLPDTV